jgi:hypothetical protein
MRNAKLASGGKEINCRCPSCSDSKDPTKGHFYIGVPQTETDLPVGYCQKCHFGCLITQQRLLEWGIYDADLALELTMHNKKALSNPMIAMKYNQSIYNINNLYVTQDKLSDEKLGYINNRLGLNLTYKDIIDNKIVLNLMDLLNSNHINEYTRHPNILNQLDNSFLGFISYDNAFVNLRRLVDEGKVYHTIDKRYVNYNIFDKKDNTCKFYVNPCQIDIANPEPIKLHIAEGPFDALSVKYNLRRTNYQSIYAAITGSGYKGLLRYFITTLKLMNLEIHIYADADIERWQIVDIAEFLSPYKYPFYLHRNVYPGEKDMGVKLELIKESVERLI